MKNILSFLIALFVLAVCLPAQTDLSTIRGNATDPTGAAVPGAKITVTDVGTNISREAATTSDGVYEIPYLTPGTYRLTATGSGFKTFVAENIIMTARQTRRIDFVFELGAVNSEVTVSANAAVISTEGSQVAGGFNTRSYSDSAQSISYFPQIFMLTLPNVQAQGGGWTLRIAGQPSGQITEALDGVPSDGPVNLVQNMNDFEDLQVVGANNSAEFSRVSNFSMTGRSGTNEFHGRAFWDFQSSALNARGFFDNQIAKYHNHHAGVSLAGPIRKNKTFFYTAYYPARVPGSTFYNRNVATDAFRAGNFSQVATIKDPLSGLPFANNAIPASRINSTSAKIQDSYIPKANQGGANTQTNNFGWLFPYTSDLYRWDSFTERVDHQFSAKNTLFGRYMDRSTPYVLAGSFPDVGTWTRTRYHNSIVVTDTHVFSPTLVNTLRWGWQKDKINDGSTVNGFTPANGDTVVKNLGLQGVNPRGYSAEGFPYTTITGITQLFVQPGGLATLARNFDYADSMTWSRGAHVLKFGGELRTFRSFSATVPTGTYGQFDFNGSFTGNGYADFLLGIPYSSTRVDPIVGRAMRSYELGIFITDTWKATRKLTLDYGLRWDLNGPSTYRDGLQYNWDPTTGNVIVPADMMGRISPLYPRSITVATGQVVPNSSRKNFRPRLGAAYLIDAKTVVRGGYGMYTETLGNYANIQGTGPFQLSETFLNSIQNGAALFAFPNPFPAGSGTVPSQSIGGYPLDTTNGTIHQFNVSVERQIRDMGVRLSYIGSRSRGLHYTLGINKPQPSLTTFTQSLRPYPQFVGASYVENDGRAKYDSVQIELTRKMGALTFNAHYTLANNMADYLNLENPYNHSFWNRDMYTARNRAVLNAAWELPFGRGRRFMGQAPHVVDGVLGGWRLMWTSTFQSGQYFSASFSGSDPSHTNTSGGLPDCIGQGNLAPSDRTVSRWFNASAFAVPASGHFGNCGVNNLEGPGMSVQNVSVIKEFKITERFRAQLQGMALDLFNSPTFSFPFSNISVPLQVGRLNSLLTAGDPANGTIVSNRFVLMRLRLAF